MRFAVVIASILVTILGCHGEAPNARLNFFDIDLLRYTAEGKKGNVMLSPASIKSTLAMLLEGAQGTTAAEIKSALRVSPVGDDFREELMVYLKALETTTSSASLDSANALYISNKLKLKKEFEMVAERMYKSTVGKLNFTDAKNVADTINAWVSQKTRGLIPTVVAEAQVPPAAEMLLANALYFKAPWKNAFDAKSTHSDCFYNNGVCRNVAMMDIQSCLSYAYVDELRAHAFELPYEGDRYSMLVLMPQDRNGVEALIRDLPYFSLPDIKKLMYTTDLVLTMPKFSVDYNEDMVKTLQTLQIKSLFNKSANLSGIFESAESPYLNSMVHSVHMTVDEVGTVAAAATISFVVPLINNKVQLRVDRPFLFFIRDVKNGVVLFEGKIDEPTEFVEKPKVQPQVPQENIKHRPPIPIQQFNSLTEHNDAPAKRPDIHSLTDAELNQRSPNHPSVQKHPNHPTLNHTRQNQTIGSTNSTQSRPNRVNLNQFSNREVSTPNKTSLNQTSGKKSSNQTDVYGEIPYWSVPDNKAPESGKPYQNKPTVRPDSYRRLGFYHSQHPILSYPGHYEDYDDYPFKNPIPTHRTESAYRHHRDKHPPRVVAELVGYVA